MMFANILRDWKVFVAIALVLLLYEQLGRYWRRSRQDRAEAWPVTTGSVTEVAIFRETYETTLTVRYTYSVPSEASPVCAEFQKQFVTPSEAEQWADALSGKTIAVRVNPRNSWESRLLDSELETIVKSTGLDCAVKKEMA